MEEAVCNLCGEEVDSSSLGKALHLLRRHPLHVIEQPSVQELFRHGADAARSAGYTLAEKLAGGKK
jgi:hypothetical protein